MTEPHKPRRMQRVVHHELSEHDENDWCVFAGCMPVRESPPSCRNAQAQPTVRVKLCSLCGCQIQGPLCSYSCKNNATENRDPGDVEYVEIPLAVQIRAQAQPTPPTPLVRALMTISQLAAAMAFENFETEREDRHFGHARIALQVEKIQAAVQEALVMVDAAQPASPDTAEIANDGYTIILQADDDRDIVASILELDGCLAHGATHGEAIRNVLEAKKLWLEAATGAPAPPVDSHRTLRALWKDAGNPRVYEAKR